MLILQELFSKIPGFDSLFKMQLFHGCVLVDGLRSPAKKRAIDSQQIVAGFNSETLRYESADSAFLLHPKNSDVLKNEYCKLYSFKDKMFVYCSLVFATYPSAFPAECEYMESFYQYFYFHRIVSLIRKVPSVSVYQPANN
jgi:hypothetical protein